MSLLRRGIISSGKLGGVTTTYYNTLLMNGSTDGVEVPDDPSLELGSSDFTISCWIQVDSLDTNGNYLVAKFYGTDTKLSWTLRNGIGDGGIAFSASSDGTINNTAAFSWAPTLGVMYHIAVEKSGTDIDLYVNGVQEGSTQTTFASIYNNNSVVTVGHYNAAGSYSAGWSLDGSVTDVIITKTTGVIAELYNGGRARQPDEYTSAVTNDMALGLPLNDGEASPENDQSGNGNDGTLVGTPTYTGEPVEFEL